MKVDLSIQVPGIAMPVRAIFDFSLTAAVFIVRASVFINPMNRGMDSLAVCG
jgi:hypothetical protein